MDTYKVAIVGQPGVITGFSALGVESHVAQTVTEAQDAISAIVEKTNKEVGAEKYAVVLVVEDLLRNIPEKEYKILTKNVLPSIVAVPGVEGSTGYTADRLRDFTIRAIGSDIT